MEKKEKFKFWILIQKTLLQNDTTVSTWVWELRIRVPWEDGVWGTHRPDVHGRTWTDSLCRKSDGTGSTDLVRLSVWTLVYLEKRSSWFTGVERQVSVFCHPKGLVLPSSSPTGLHPNERGRKSLASSSAFRCRRRPRRRRVVGCVTILNVGLYHRTRCDFPSVSLILHSFLFWIVKVVLVAALPFS